MSEAVKIHPATLAKLEKAAAMWEATKKEGRENAIPFAKAMIPMAAIGLAGSWLWNTDTVQNNETIKNHWWVPSALLGIGAYLLYRKRSPYALPVAMLAAYWGYAFYQRDADRQKTTPTTTPKQPGQVQGFGYWNQDTGAPLLYPAGNGLAWMQTANGGWMTVRMPQAPQRPALAAAAGGSAFQPTQEDFNAAAEFAAAAYA